MRKQSGARKIVGIGSEVDVDFGSKGVKKCVIESMRRDGIGVRIIPKGRKVHVVMSSKIQLN